MSRFYHQLAARTAHEVNRAYCAALGDESQLPWDEAPSWQKASALVGVRGYWEGEITSPEESHASWMKVKEADGWKYGPVKDPEKKEHPCMVPYSELPAEQRVKDYLFQAVVQSFMSRYKVKPKPRPEGKPAPIRVSVQGFDAFKPMGA